MKTCLYFTFLIFFLAQNPSAFAAFSCSNTGENPYTVKVAEKTRSRSFAVASLSHSSITNGPLYFICDSKSLTNDGEVLTEYACQSAGTRVAVAHLFLYTAEKDQKFRANLSSETLKIEIENMVCNHE